MPDFVDRSGTADDIAIIVLKVRYEMGEAAMMTGAWTLACLLLIPGAPADGQDAIPFNTREFTIPIRILKERQHTIQRLELYYSLDGGTTWQPGPTAEPSSQGFSFKAAEDGEHWFCVLVVDKAGRKQPRDPYTAPVGQKILIDTMKPDLHFVKAQRKSIDSDEIVVTWECEEEHPDLSTFQLQYKTATGEWVSLPVTPSLKGQHTFRAGLQPVSIRLQMADRVKNEGTAIVQVPAADKGLIASDTNNRGGSSVPPPLPGGFPVPGSESESIQPVISHNTEGSEPNLTPPPSLPTKKPGSGSAIATSTVPRRAPRDVTPMPGTAPRSNWNNAQTIPVVNTRQVTLEYEVTKYGPSGLGTADLYVTRDDGRTWERYPQVKHTNLPSSEPRRFDGVLRRALTIDLQDEGVYGFHLVVKSGAGRSKPAPRAGTSPQLRMELDTTLPSAALYPLEAHRTLPHVLVLLWKARDKNLAAAPITLQWAAQPSGPWQTIGSEKLANTGNHQWAVPRDIPPSVYLRLTVRDLAGNTAVAQTAEPVPVDMHTPEVKSLKLMGIGSQPRH